MADYTYLGMTAYIQEDKFMHEKMLILAEAIDTLSIKVPPVKVGNRDYYKHITESDAYKFLYDNDNVCYVEECYQPKNTPVAYNDAQIERITVNGVNLIRLYVPTNAKNDKKLNQFVKDALVPVLSMLFGDQLISVKTRTALEYEEFANAREEVIISADKQKEAKSA